ncbi:hypothetical protein Pmani_024593 [Petrolisthes manimaculis]|uniref:Uncharacterized protein n=1 Tax=Petrolisthes manimaculis TaxID=1843537 RepID=A0AAE1PA05_9EUCA|nr:hypothetical protein Pmani_024593 [Petrolisthes manimaculis]
MVVVMMEDGGSDVSEDGDGGWRLCRWLGEGDRMEEGEMMTGGRGTGVEGVTGRVMSGEGDEVTVVKCEMTGKVTEMNVEVSVMTGEVTDVDLFEMSEEVNEMND